MTPRCIRCHHPMKHSRPSGMGKVCESKSPTPIPAVERDLFGFDIPAACVSATERVRVHIDGMAVDAVIALRHRVNAARRRLGVWSAQ